MADNIERCQAKSNGDEVPTTCQEMMKVVECKEDDSMHKKWVRSKPHNSQQKCILEVQHRLQVAQTSGIKIHPRTK
jgi:hypothetical protein